ncbi:MAG: hypothetical protein ACFFBP_17345 [Promethearchaeota archaeon]
MANTIDIKHVEKIFNTQEFKKWLISKRWFGNKLELVDLKFIIQIEYFKSIEERILLLIIKIIKQSYSKSYFLPLINYMNVHDILDTIEVDKNTLQNIKDHIFEGDLKLIEAEYCFFFWKIILRDIELNEAFKFPENYIFSLHQLGKDNTTNLLFSIEIKSKESIDKPAITYVLKSYKSYSENLEIMKLSILNENYFQNVPKILDTIEINEITVICIMEIVPNIGNIGEIYWNELNDMVNEISNEEKNIISLTNRNRSINLIHKFCVESIKISTLIGEVIGNLLKGLIKSGNIDFSIEYIDAMDYFSERAKIIGSISSILIKNSNQLGNSYKILHWNKSELNNNIVGVKKIVNKLKNEYKEKKIRIQPIHQDLHMEQILYNKNNGEYMFYILDLEGDPQLSIKEKKKKFPIEKDIASFLRALSYIKLNMLLSIVDKRKNLNLSQISNQSDELIQGIQTILNIWEIYFTELILKNIEVDTTLMHLFTIERILNEMKYELLYRPKKIIIPLLGLKEIITQEY